VPEGARQQGRAVGRMSHRAASRLAWSMCGLSLALTALSLVLLIRSWSHPNVHVFDYWVENTMVAVVFSTVGAVVASRRPDHPVGWLFCVIGLVGGIRHLGAEYAIYSLLVTHGSLPGGAAAAWVSSWMWVPHVGLMVFLGLLFPDGLLPTARWRPFAWFVVVAIVVGTVALALSPGPLSGLGPIQNPFGIEGMGRVVGQVHALVWALVLVAAASLLLRLRHARGLERQQIKWLAFAGAVAAIGGPLTYVGGPAVMSMLWVQRVGLALIVVGFAGVPIAMSIAILKYRLYDIDILINRTLVYGTLTAILAALYLGVVVALQRVFVAFTGQESTLAVVASTLLIAALFNPMRRRLQGFVDRRFYRRKYDAAKTLEAFSAKLRDETDLDALSDDLVGVVRETMQPAHVSLWLRPDTASKGEKLTEPHE
jgi:hypothetical protein